jgi:Ca2+-binding RTX toxin-like protein
MAIVVAGNTGIDVNNSEIGMLAEGTPVGATSTYVGLRFEQWLDEFYGSFQYNVFGELAGGTLNRWKQTFNGQLVFEVSGADVAVSSFLTWVEADANVLAAQTIFAGADTMTGSAFSDNLYGYAGNDSLVGGGDADTLDGGAGLDTISGGAGADVIRDASGQNYLRGNEGDDNLTGGIDFDDVHGNQGNDTVSGGGGDDWVVGGQDNDLQFGGDGFDVVYGNLGADTLNGDGGNDWVRGGQQSDVLNGGAGDDWMSGDRDNDTLTGGAGADLFNLFAGSGLDRITDFSLAQGDKIRWEGGVPNYAVAQVGADAVISWGAGDQVTLVGVQASSLNGTGWFVAA